MLFYVSGQARPSAILATDGSEYSPQVFVSYHQEDQVAVDRFVSRFGPRNFIKSGITVPSEVVDSDDTDCVLGRIRELYLRDCTVTIVCVGLCTMGA